MTAVNDITRNKIQTKPVNDKYASEWERIFGNKEKETKDEKHSSDNSSSN